MTPAVIEWSSLTRQECTRTLRRPETPLSAAVRDVAADIISAVREEGDAAVRRFAVAHDGVELASLQVSPAEKAAARAALSDDDIAAIDAAISNVRAFHEAQVPQSIRVETMPGVVCERVSHPIDSVGLYVPAGTAPLPSAAIMLAVPAVIAGCPLQILCTPPRSDGTADPAVIVAATQAGIDTIFKIGGAQAIGAMAYGTETVPAVEKIFGPGNAYVTTAKSLVSADVNGAAIDMPAGPSEVLVIADDSADPGFVAADLLSQAEHGIDSQVLLLTPSAAMADSVSIAIEQQLDSLSRKEIAASAMAHSKIIVVADIAAAVEVSNTYAPEHLILQVSDPRSLLPVIRNAGSVFVGPWTPESVGDYCSGTNHVLPTYGYAKTYSGLGVEQFCRSMTVQELSAEGLVGIADSVVTLARLEGLDGHAAAVTRRLESRG